MISCCLLDVTHVRNLPRHFYHSAFLTNWITATVELATARTILSYHLQLDYCAAIRLLAHAHPDPQCYNKLK